MSEGFEDTPLEAYAAFSEAVRLLAATPVADGALHRAFSEMWRSGKQPTRFYHSSAHFHDIAAAPLHKTAGDFSNELAACRRLAGFNHDVVYQHVDCKSSNRTGFAPGVLAKISRYIAHGTKNSLHLATDPALDDDLLFQAALALFGWDEDSRTHRDEAMGKALHFTQGQNEFLSALYAMEQGRALGVPPQWILAEMAHIEATVPFRPQDHFAQLRTRLETANGLLPEDQRFSARQMDAIIESSIGMANRDVDSFRRPFTEFVKDSRALLRENVAGGAQNINHPAYLFAAAKNMALFLEGVAADSPGGTRRIFHPPLHGAENTLANEARACENIALLGTYLRAQAAAAALISAMAISRPGARRLALLADAPMPMQEEQTEEPAATLLAACHGAVGNRLATDAAAAHLIRMLGPQGAQALGELALHSAYGAALAEYATPDAAGTPRELAAKAGNFLEEVRTYCAAQGVKAETLTAPLLPAAGQARPPAGHGRA